MFGPSYCNVTEILKKMASSDSDLRFMAVNDFITHLQSETVNLDDQYENRIVTCLRSLLQDKHVEVQNVAVKCLGLLINRINPYRVDPIMDDYFLYILSEEEHLRDIGSIGIKNVISQLPLSCIHTTRRLGQHITDCLGAALRDEKVRLELEILEMLAEILHKFGYVLPHQLVNDTLQTVKKKFASSRQAVRKRAIVVYSILSVYCDGKTYGDILADMKNQLSVNGKTHDICRTYLQAVVAVCSKSGGRFKNFVSRFYSLIVVIIEEPDDEIREYCLRAFQQFVERCPTQLTNIVPAIVEMCLRYLSYDPHYNYDEEDQADVRKSGSDDEEEDNEPDYDDMSWRVRRAAIRCLQAIILGHYKKDAKFYKTVALALIRQFRDRNENVKIEIFEALISLLKQPRVVSIPAEEESTLFLLQLVPTLVIVISNHIERENVNTRQACFNLLKALCDTLPGALSPYMGNAIVPGILYLLQNETTTSSFKIEVLSFMNFLFTCQPHEVFHPHISTLLPAILGAVQVHLYKTSKEALLVLQDLIKVMRPLNQPSSFDYALYVSEIYESTLTMINVSDAEVKEQAILTMGQVVSSFGDCLQEELSVCMPLFLNCLKNETTRLATIKALKCVAESVVYVNLRIINEAMPILGSFLRQNQRVLKLTTLQLLDRFVKVYYNRIEVHLLQKVLVNVPPLLDKSDLLISQWTLVFLESVTHHHSFALIPEVSTIFSKVLTLLQSPCIQGTLLTTTSNFLQGLVKCNLEGFGMRKIMNALIEPVFGTGETVLDTGEIGLDTGETVLDTGEPVFDTKKLKDEHKKPVYNSLAICVAAVIATCKDQVRLVVVPFFLQHIQNPQCEEDTCIFSLLVVTEIGRKVDLLTTKGLRDAIIRQFSANSDKVKYAASTALGGISVGSLQKSLPFILDHIKPQYGDHQHHYLYLSALKEIITSMAANEQDIEQLAPFISNIWEQLLPYGESNKEGVRNIVVECLGQSIRVNPSTLLPELQKSLDHPSPLMRATAVLAVKFLINDKPQPLDQLLTQRIKHFLDKLQDPDVSVRWAALVVFNSAAHNKPSLIGNLLEDFLPHLYNATKKDKALTCEEQMGPYVRVIDKGLDIRKAAYECMYTLLDSYIHQINIYDFLHYVRKGFCDHRDIKMLIFLIVENLAKQCPVAVLLELDELLRELLGICLSLLPRAQVAQQQEQQDEVGNCALRTIVALLKIPDSVQNASAREVVSTLRTTPYLWRRYETYWAQSGSSPNNPVFP